MPSQYTGGDNYACTGGYLRCLPLLLIRTGCLGGELLLESSWGLAEKDMLILRTIPLEITDMCQLMREVTHSHFRRWFVWG